MLQSNETIYLFSSTSRDQYIQDALNILALPTGAIFHFRYNLKYVGKKLSPKHIPADDQYRQSLQKYSGGEVLIVFVNQPQKAGSTTPDEDIHFYPLRQAKIKEFELDGIVLHVFFELAQYVNLDQQRFDTFDAEIIKQLDRNDQRPPGKYISIGSKILGEDALVSLIHSSTGWMSTVNTLSQLSVFKNTVFYRSSGMRKVRTHQVAQESSQRSWTANMLTDNSVEEEVRIDEILPYQSGYSLKSDGVYSLDLSFYHSEEVKEPVLGSKILVQIDEARFAFQPNDIEVNFRYDLQPVQLIPIPVTQDAFTNVRLMIEQKEDKVFDPPLRAPITDFVIKLTYPRFRYVGALILLIAAQILVALPDVITAFPGFLVAFIKVLGSVITAVVLFVMLRKLPGS
jgi:hypothetical protein